MVARAVFLGFAREARACCLGSMSSTPLISLENVRVTLGGRAVLSEITWTLHQGSLWSVWGPNGAGKSTFLKLLKGDIWPDAIDGGRRRYHFDAEPRESPAELKEQIAWVAPEQQDRYWRQEWELTSGAVIESGFYQTDYVGHRLTRACRRAASGISDTLGIGHLWNRNVQTLSQGELRRVLIARALVAKPRVLLLDEVTQGLDRTSRLNLFQVLEGVVKAGTAVVLTTHRPDERIPGYGRLLSMEDGRITDGGAEGDALHLVQGASSFDRACSSRGSQGAELWAKKSPPRPRIHRETALRSAISCDPLISLRGVNVYLDRKRVVKDVHWTVRRGEHWAVLGANGSGKSTLIKTLVGDLHPAWGGEVGRFQDEMLSTLWDVRARVGYLAADFQSTYEWDKTARDVVGSGFFASVGLMHALTSTQQRMVEGVLALFHLEALADRIFDQLSYGQRRRILLARAVVHSPKLLALDEPFDGLDSSARQQWIGTLGMLAGRGTTLILVTHHEEDVPGWFTHVLKMQDGCVVHQGLR